MDILIQSLSWTLIYSLGQGLLFYLAVRVVMKLLPNSSSALKYNFSLSALSILFVWFAMTWWQQYQQLSVVELAPNAASSAFFSTWWPSGFEGVQEQDLFGSVILLFKKSIAWIGMFYFLGLFFMLLRLSAGVTQLFSLKRNTFTDPETALDKLLHTLISSLKIKGSVRLRISDKVQVPMVIGFLKPIILMPAAAVAQLSMEQLETILVHELAHIRRSDYLVNLLQTIIETILFFNPFVWMISAIIRREREHCCDDLVLDHTREPLSYATALAALAAYPDRRSGLAVAASGQSNYLFHRIKRIMEMKKNPLSYSRMAAAVLMLATMTCSVVWLTPTFARTVKNKPAKTAPPTLATSGEMPAARNIQEENTLLERLAKDKLIDELKGFAVAKRQQNLFINGEKQSDEMARKYLNGIQQADLDIIVAPFKEWQQRQIKSGNFLLQNNFFYPSKGSDYKSRRDGC